MQAHIVLDRIREHSRAHGAEILRKSLESEFYKAEKAKAAPKGKRWLSTELTFARALAPAHHGVVFSDVPKKEETPAWRAGIDQAPAAHDLESAVPQLMAAELDSLPLHVKDDGAGNKALCASQGFREGDTVVACRCLLFSTARGVANFLNTEGNGVLLDGPLLHISGLATATDEKMELFAVQVGVSMFIPDFRGKKGRANVTLRITPSLGANDGFLSFVAQTRNACGIAAGSPILCDFGESYRQTHGDPASSPAKRFRGALDVLVAKQWQALGRQAADNTEGTETPAGATGPDGKDMTVGAGAGGDAGPRRTAGAGTAASGAGPAAAANAAANAAATAAPKAGATAAAAKAGSTAAAPKAATAAKAAAATAAAPDKTVLATKGDVSLAVAGTRLVLRSSAASNCKVSPRTLFLTWSNGSVDSHGDAALPQFKFEKPKDLVVDFGTQTVVSLGDFIKKYSADKLFGHAPFTKGVPPTSFAAKEKQFRYKPHSSEDAKHMSMALACEKGLFLWLVACTEGKITPKGLGLLNKSQVIVKTGEDFVL